MKRSLIVLVMLVVALVNVDAQQKKNPVFEQIQDNPALPQVLLIGDSISIGYTLPTREMLQGTANVHRIPTNGGPTIRGWDNINNWIGKKKWDVIHFNWGLHDLKYLDDGKHQVPLEYYALMLERLVKRLKQTEAALIWCSTTPVPEGKVSPRRDPADVVRYNQAALKIMKKHGVQVNDLYGFALPLVKDIQRPVNVHFTDDGSKQLADQVVKHIKDVLKK